MFHYKTTLFLFFLLFFGFKSNILCGQQPVAPLLNAPSNVSIHPSLKKQQSVFKLTNRDLQDAQLVRQYRTEANGVQHFVWIQTLEGIELLGGVLNMNLLPSGEILSSGNRFIPDLATKVKVTKPVLSAESAIQIAAKKLGITQSLVLKRSKQIDNQSFVFNKTTDWQEDVKVKLHFFQAESASKSEIRLVWQVTCMKRGQQDRWSFNVDATDGNVLNQTNQTIYCQFESAHVPQKEADCQQNVFKNKPTDVPFLKQKLVNTGSYRVFALPIESPTNGNRTLEVNPADATASPFGWHDNNGIAGADFQITKGNNVHSYADETGIDSISSPEPNGGPNLIFDAPFDPTLEPIPNRNAGVINLFYQINRLHDITYKYGFDEQAGNFQDKNYSNVPGGADFIKARALSGRLNGSANNAFFVPSPDGDNGLMSMFVWTRTQDTLLHVTAPANLAGPFETGLAGFGATISNTPISGATVWANDGSLSPNLGCNTLINNVLGKIVFFERGTCEFGRKALTAQQQGAIGCVVCNYGDAVGQMASGSFGSQVTIPTVMLKKSDCDRLRNSVGNGLNVTFQSMKPQAEPQLYDSDFDNGIIAHEFMHGVSNRLTGTTFGCMQGVGEMPSEGWSDFLGLAVTAKATDRAAQRRGIGTYVARQGQNGNGIRKYPYSNDLNINPLTYDDIILDSEIHAVGTVWTAMLWDLYWKMIDIYGFDSNLNNIHSGNGKALRLVMDGMKMQVCNPGFVEARDGILAADRADFSGAHQCLIWDVFARRGLGFRAKQGEATKTDDGQENFEPFPYCNKALKLEKIASESVRAGQQIVYTLKLINHKGVPITGVSVYDTLAIGTTYVPNSGGTLNNNIVIFNNLNINAGDTLILTYKALSAFNRCSGLSFEERFESGGTRWQTEILKGTAADGFQIKQKVGINGSNAWSLEYQQRTGTIDVANRLIAPIRVIGTNPVLRFEHKYGTEVATDGGIVQISTNGGTIWQDLSDKMFQNPYRGNIDPRTFEMPTKAFWGNSPNYQSTYIDLAAYRNQDILLRFRFATDTAHSGTGWQIDNILLMDMLTYQSGAIAVSAQQDTAKATLPYRGTVIEPLLCTNTNELNTNDLKINIFPNPSSETTLIHFDRSITGQLHIVDVTGKLIFKSDLKEAILETISVANWAKGAYFATIQTDSMRKTLKIIVY
jgi:extracellular elastinolytic metalloproteinase